MFTATGMIFQGCFGLMPRLGKKWQLCDTFNNAIPSVTGTSGFWRPPRVETRRDHHKKVQARGKALSSLCTKEAAPRKERFRWRLFEETWGAGAGFSEELGGVTAGSRPVKAEVSQHLQSQDMLLQASPGSLAW